MKYMGSKNRLAKYLLPIILKNRKPGQYYVEPFVGGANMIDKVENPRIGGELNKYIAALLIEMERGWTPKKMITQDDWLAVKANKDMFPAHYVGFMGTQLSFGSVWFCSFRKENGGDRNYAQEAYNSIAKQGPNLKGVEFYCSSYDRLKIPEQSIIYCDPPYEGTDKYRGFEQIDHPKFWDWCRNKVKEGHKVFISEFNAPEDFICIWEMEKKSPMAEKSHKINIEKLFIHKSQNKMNLLDEFAAEFDKPAAPKRTVRMIDAYEVYRKEHPGDYPSNYVTYLQFAEMCASATTGPLSEVIIPVDDGLTNSQRYIRDRDKATRPMTPEESFPVKPEIVLERTTSAPEMQSIWTEPEIKQSVSDFDIEPAIDDTGQVDLFALPATPAPENIINFSPKVGDRFKSSNEDDGYFEVISVKPTDNKPKPKESGVIANAFKNTTPPMLDKALDQAEPKVSLFNVTGEPADKPEPGFYFEDEERLKAVREEVESHIKESKYSHIYREHSTGALPTGNPHQIRITVLGDPTAQKRHRHAKLPGSNFSRVYDPSAADKADFLALIHEHAPAVPFDCALRMDVFFYFSRPTSHFRSGANAHLLKPSAPIWKISKPDRDNLDKLCMDAMKGVYFRDDSVVCAGEIIKKYDANPRTEIIITVL